MCSSDTGGWPPCWGRERALGRHVTAGALSLKSEPIARVPVYSMTSRNDSNIKRGALRAEAFEITKQQSKKKKKRSWRKLEVTIWIHAKLNSITAIYRTINKQFPLLVTFAPFKTNLWPATRGPRLSADGKKDRVWPVLRFYTGGKGRRAARALVAVKLKIRRAIGWAVGGRVN